MGKLRVLSGQDACRILEQLQTGEIAVAQYTSSVPLPLG